MLDIFRQREACLRLVAIISNTPQTKEILGKPTKPTFQSILIELSNFMLTFFTRTK